MIITLIKKQTGIEFIKEMEKTYKSINELEKLFNIFVQEFSGFFKAGDELHLRGGQREFFFDFLI